ncbi:tetratricopeptide repeat protein [candidate division KSB1 bacterium]|nr:tetratricopeptide repeat protein [candidate division KSB1 bacterium]
MNRSKFGVCWLLVVLLMSSFGYGQDYVAEAGKFFLMKDYKTAIEKYKLALAKKPGDARVHYNLGVCYEKLGEYPTALASYQKALELQPGFKDAQEAIKNVSMNTDLKNQQIAGESLLKANTAFLKKDYTTAIAEYQKVIEVAPRNFQALFNLGSCYEQVGEYKNALNSMERGLAQNPASVEAQTSVQRLKRLYQNQLIEEYKRQVDIALDENQLGLAQNRVRQILGLSPNDDWAMRKMRSIQARIEIENQTAASQKATIDSLKLAQVVDSTTLAKTVQKTDESGGVSLKKVLFMIGGGLVVVVVLVLLLTKKRKPVTEVNAPPSMVVAQEPKTTPPAEVLPQKSVYDNIQDFYNSKKTGILRMQGQTRTGGMIEGEIRILNGNIVDSISNENQGVAALYQLLEIETISEITFQKIQITDSGNIRQATLPLLMQWTLGMKKEQA